MKQHQEKDIIIVSGLPRSGTSMMMQALAASGLDILADGVRKSDEDNPKGYYEYERVKKIKEDRSWLPDARGKAVKMVYKLLYDLPDDYQYRVLFMRRSIAEVIASQNRMLARLGKEGAGIEDDQLAALFEKELAAFFEWINGKANFSLLEVNYQDMVSETESICRRVIDFLQLPLDVQKMSEAVDPSLYRNRIC